MNFLIKKDELFQIKRMNFFKIKKDELFRLKNMNFFE